MQSRPLGQFKSSTSFARSVPPSPSPSPEPYTSAPWAQVTVSVDGSTAPTFELLDKTIRDISGPRDDELVVFDNEVDKPDSRSAGCKRLLEYAKNKTLPDTDIGQLRMYYCRWIDANAAIAQEIRSSHVAFFKWLNCMGW